MREPTTRFVLEAPAGLIQVEAECSGGKAVSIKLEGPPAFCRPRDQRVVVQVPDMGPVKLDIAYGGMHYAIVDAASVGLSLIPANGRRICQLGEMIKVACREQHPVNHPEFDYPGCDILCFREPAYRNSHGRLRARNAVVMSNGNLEWGKPETYTGMLDRSPCGTGTCAVMALLYSKGELSLGEDFEHESIVGSTFVGRLNEETVIGEGTGDEVLGVRASIIGSAFVTQSCTVFLHATDPFPRGLKVHDIW